jgi:hypothetical protein
LEQDEELESMYCDKRQFTRPSADPASYTTLTVASIYLIASKL